MTDEKFEDIFGNVPFENIKKIQEYINENYIHKSKIQDKIDDLRKVSTDYFETNEEIGEKAQLEVLQELLESEK